MAQYDAIAQQYNAEMKGRPYYEKIVDPTLTKLLGEIKGKKILDLACGDGVRTLFIKRLGLLASSGLGYIPR